MRYITTQSYATICESYLQQTQGEVYTLLISGELLASMKKVDQRTELFMIILSFYSWAPLLHCQI